MPTIAVDLYSDTLTKPTRAMRAFMCDAEVGDEQKGEDPTVNRLQEMVADLLGKEAALFLPSGTMCNEIALKVHTRPGDEVLMDKSAHPIHFEAGAPGLLSGVMITGLDGARGIYTPEQVEAAVHPLSRHAPPTRLLWVENTSNLGGGTIWPLARIEAVCATARRHGLATHMDGARLLNAVVASGVAAAAYAAPFDSVWIDFTKGLGAPVGAALAGSRAFIQEAWRYKQAFGGAMRQAGIIAAGGIYALEHNVERLAENHAHARILAEGLAEMPGVAIDPRAVETNLVFFDVSALGITAAEWCEAILAHGVRMNAMGPHRVRAVTHLDVDRAGIDRALAASRTVAQGAR
ncbi:MAG TPA: GntG family PLP-dependent aldolase [Thermomicrobiales bacterium]